MDHLGLVAGLQVPEDRGVIEEGQVDHVLALLELGWVDSTHISCLEREPAYIIMNCLILRDLLTSLTSRVQQQRPS